MQNRVYDPEGVSTVIMTSSYPKIIDDTYKCREPRVYEEASPTLRSDRNGLKVVAGQFQPVDRDYKTTGGQRAEHFECRNDDVA